MDTGKKTGTGLKTVIIVLLAALILCFSVFVYRYEYNIFFERETVSLAGYQREVVQNSTRRVDFYNSMESMINKKEFIRLNIVLTNVQNLTSEAKDQLVEESETDVAEYESDFYYLNKNMQVIRQYAVNPMTLSDEELSQLLQNKTLVVNQRCYVACELEDGYYVVGTDTDYSALYDIDYDTSKAVPYIIWNNTTGEISDYGGDDFPEELKDITSLDIEQEILTTVNGVTVGRIKVGNQTYLAAYNSCDIAGTDVTVSVFSEDGRSHREALAGALVFALLSILFAGCTVSLITKLRKKRFSEENETQNGNVRHYRSYRSRMKFSVGTMTAFFMIVSYILFFLQNMMVINTDISTAFNNLSLMEESYLKNEEVVYSSITKNYLEYVEDIAWALQYRYEIDTDEWLAETAEILNFDEITLYDGDGVIVNSSGCYKGYKLPENETDVTYPLWQILRGGKESLVFFDDETGTAYIASRRMDDTGILLLVSSSNIVTPLLESVDFADVLSIQMYPGANILYTNRDDSKTLYFLESGSPIAKSMTNILPDTGDGDFTIGVREMNGQHYLFFDMGSADRVIAYTYPLADLVTESLIYLLMTTAVFLVIAVLLFYVLVGKDSVEDTGTVRVNSPELSTYEQFTKEQHEQLYYFISVLTLFSLCVLFVVKTFSGGTSFVQYLDYWEKGFNMISVFYCVVLLIQMFGVIILIGRVNALVGKLMTSKGATICTLLTNIVRLIYVVICFVSILEQFGVNAVAILSSLGLVGLALSMGSKDVISDMLAGLFMAFEGQFQIGDFVEINGFSGEITSLGIRTTKIQFFNQEFILNNSSMKNAVNYSRGNPVISFSIVLPYDTDLDFVAKLTKDSRERFVRATNNELTGNLWLQGVSDCKNYGMEALFLAIVATAKDSKICPAQCSMEMITLLRENGIKPVEVLKVLTDEKETERKFQQI